jgi:hypothetical protein
MNTLLASILFLMNCPGTPNLPGTRYHKTDSFLPTGWYYIAERAGGWKRKLARTSEVFFIDPIPVVTVKDFKGTLLFHEKDCYALIIQLDSNCFAAWALALQKAKGKKLAFIIDDSLLQTPVVDGQFAREDPGEFGEIYALPCLSYSGAELKRYRAIIEGEKR